MAEFFQMGGYAAYVWSAYGATAAVVLGVLVWSWRGLYAAEKAEARLAHRPRRRPARRTKPSGGAAE